MPTVHESANARRVITGVDEHGQSTIVSDEHTPARHVAAGNTKCDIWRIDSLPASMGDGDGLSAGVITQPPGAGLVYRVVTFSPDSEWDMSKGYGDTQGRLAGTVAIEDAHGIPGLHFTDSVDFLTVLSGEIYAVLENGETLLRAGDTIVQRGTKHAWHNRSDEPVVVVSVMVGAAPREPRA